MFSNNTNANCFLFQLLHDQVAVVSFEAYKSLFMETFARGRSCLHALPSLPPLFGYPHRNWSVAAGHPRIKKYTCLLTIIIRCCQTLWSCGGGFIVQAGVWGGIPRPYCLMMYCISGLWQEGGWSEGRCSKTLFLLSYDALYIWSLPGRRLE